MAVESIHPGAHPTPLRRAARATSLVLLVLTAVVIVGADLPATAALGTHPFESTCFLALLFGLAIAWRHPLQAGALTLVAWALLAAISHGASAMPLAAYLAAALLNLAAGRRPEPRNAGH